MARPKSNKETDSIRRLIHQRLQRGALKGASQGSGGHFDEDALSAFVEGRLSETEAAPFTSHLVRCDFCRRITAQLIRLESEVATIGTEVPPQRSTEEEPGRFRRLLSDLASRVVPSSEDDAVFAYHAPAEDFEKRDEGHREQEGLTPRAEETIAERTDEDSQLK